MVLSIYYFELCNIIIVFIICFSFILKSLEENAFLPARSFNFVSVKIQPSGPYIHRHCKENEGGANTETFF
jgi:hypothetical protein